MHSMAACALMVALARELGLSEAETRQAGLAGLLHDIGKAGIPLDALNKPCALTDEEFSLVKVHPERGHKLLMQAKIMDAVAIDVCLHYHEKVNGKGYPPISYRPMKLVCLPKWVQFAMSTIPLLQIALTKQVGSRAFPCSVWHNGSSL